MSLTKDTADGLLKHLLGSDALYASLHTEDPGGEANQTTSEVSYNGYSRMPLSTDGEFWFIDGGAAVNSKPITFAQSGSGPQTARYVGIGTKQDGEGKLLFCAAIRSPQQGLVINPNIIPSIRAGALRVGAK